MTVRELVNELTRHSIDWDLEVHVCITDNIVKSGEPTQWEDVKIDACDLFNPTWYEGKRRCHLVLERIDKKKNMDKHKIIKKLDRLKEDNPNQIISIETPNRCVECKIGDANIYEGCNGEIVIDSE
jgi:hypothetical protein